MAKKRGDGNPGVPNLEGARGGLLKERAQYDAKKEAYEGMEEKLSAEFTAGLDASLSDDDRDVLLEGDIVAITQMVDAKRQAYVGDRLADEQKELELFESELEKKEMQLEDLGAEASFREGHPDLDTEGFAAYLKGEMSPNKREELLAAAEGDKVKFLGLVAEQFLESTGAAPKGVVELPTDISDIAGATGDIDSGDGFEDDVDNDYLAQVGL